MVMPCSRSARRPSVSSARFISSRPRRNESRSTAASVSSRMDLVSYRSRPMRVLLPSSTDPAVATRRRPALAIDSPPPWLTLPIKHFAPESGAKCLLGRSEVALALAVFHGGLREAVVGPGGAALGDAGGGDLLDDLLAGA